MVTYCTVCLNNTRRRGEISYFSYPGDLVRRIAWLQAVGRNDLIPKFIDRRVRQQFRICEEHFKPTCIKYSKKRTKKYLHDDAFPTLNLPKTHEAITREETEAASRNQGDASSTQEHDSIPDVLFSNTNCAISETVVFEDHSSGSEQDEQDGGEDAKSDSGDGLATVVLNVPANIERKRKYSSLKPVKAKKNKRNDLESVTKEDFLKLCDKFVSKGLTEIINWQIDLKAGHREERQTQARNFFALNLHYSGPVAYRFLKNTFCLPSLSAIQSFVRPVDTKIDRRLLSALKLKVDKMGTKEKICSVCVGSIPVKPHLFYDISNDRIIGFHDINGNQKPEPAKYFLVVMIRGIIHNWKQPIAHAFLSQRENDPEVKEWIDIVITTLLDIGLDIRILVSDFESGFVSTSKSMSIDKTYFEINGHKIYYMFDSPPLITNLKASLEKRDFILDDEYTNRWGDLCNQENRKLTDHPEIDKKVDVKIIGQDLSNAIGTKAITNIHLNLKNSDEFLKGIINLYDFLNSSTKQSPDKFKRALCGCKFQIDFLQKMLESFKHLKFLKNDAETDITDTDHCIKGIQVSIGSLLQLYEDLKGIEIKYIYTRRLNGGVLEKFFRKVRQAGVGRRKVTCHRASSIFKHVFTCDILKSPSGTNCNEDFDSLIRKQEDYRTLYSSSSQVLRHKRVSAIKVGTYDYQFDLPEKNALIYVSCYLYRKCIGQHKCEKIKSYIEDTQDAANSSNDSSPSLRMNANKASMSSDVLVIPPETFVSYIKSLEKKFREQFDLAENITNVGNGILKLLEDSTFDMQCECFPIEYLKKLYARFRIYQTIKRNNELLKADLDKQV